MPRGIAFALDLALSGRIAAVGVVAFGVLLASPQSAFAADSTANANTAQAELTAVEKDASTVQAAVDRANAQRVTAEQKIANGELLFRSNDHARAVVILSEVLEEFPDTPSYVDALWLRGETYYNSKEFLAARRDYRALIERTNEPRFAPYLSKTLARLVDVCLRLNDLRGLDEVFAKLNQVPPSMVDAGLNYAKGKAYYARKDYSAAHSAFAAVGPGTTYSHQARYFEGLVAMRTASSALAPTAGATTLAPNAPANYKSAIEAFRRATELAGDTDEHKQVVDLSWLAIARLFYEMEQYAQAADAYQKVGRDSKEFDTMLYELAWTYVRMGDVQRAERALEVLSISDPNSAVLGEGTLLRADLLLRAGSFRKALTLYETVKDKYDPMRTKVESFLDSTKDPSVYYEKLSQQQLDVLDQTEQLPSLAVKWAREAEDGPMAFAVIDDVNQCKTLIHQSYAIVEKLSALISAGNRVRAFPELLAGEEQALGLLNRISRARLEIGRGLDMEEPSDLGGEIGKVRQERRTLMLQMEGLPFNSADFARRDYAGMKQWNTISQDVTAQALEIDRLNAVINGLRRILREDAQRGVARDPAMLAKAQEQLDTEEHELKQRQKNIEELRKQIEFGRAQIGLGDVRYQNDAAARGQFRDLLEKEVDLAAQGQAGSGAQKYALRVQLTLRQARPVEEKLIAAFLALESQVDKRIGNLRDRIDTEKTKITGYEGQLGKLDDEARGLVGLVAKRNFELVRDKLRNIVLRADVGITEQAWEVREEEIYRVQALQTDRAKQEQALDDELREVLDDSGDAKK